MDFREEVSQNIELLLPFSFKRCIMETVPKGTIYSVLLIGEKLVRNRGYKFIINRDQIGYWMLCINPTWINDILRDKNIDPRGLRSISWKEMAQQMTDRYSRELFMKLQPKNFWQMCDVFALTMSEYVEDYKMPVYKQKWFSRYPIFAAEDVYELLLEEGMEQEDALRITEVVRRGRCTIQEVSVRDFLELYDVPDQLIEAIRSCEFLADRQSVICGFLDTAKAILEEKERNINPFY